MRETASPDEYKAKITKMKFAHVSISYIQGWQRICGLRAMKKGENVKVELNAPARARM